MAHIPSLIAIWTDCLCENIHGLVFIKCPNSVKSSMWLISNKHINYIVLTGLFKSQFKGAKQNTAGHGTWYCTEYGLSTNIILLRKGLYLFVWRILKWNVKHNSLPSAILMVNKLFCWLVNLNLMDWVSHQQWATLHITGM